MLTINPANAIFVNVEMKKDNEYINGEVMIREQSIDSIHIEKYTRFQYLVTISTIKHEYELNVMCKKPCPTDNDAVEVLSFVEGIREHLSKI